MFALAGATLDAMMRANTKLTIKEADIIINVPLAEFGSLDWRRSSELIAEGYKAAEAMRDRLLPLAVSEDEYAQVAGGAHARAAAPRCRSRRSRASRASAPATSGTSTALLARHIGVAFSTELSRPTSRCCPASIATRPSPGASSTTPPARTACSWQARPKPYGPPFLMLGLNLENTTSEDFRVTLTGRYLAYDVIGSGSELRIDGTLGSDPGLAFALYRPLRRHAAVRRALRRHCRIARSTSSRTMRSWRVTDSN